MKMRFSLLVLVGCLLAGNAFGYPSGCAGSRGVCEWVQNGGVHVCPKCGRHVVPDGRGMFKMVPADQCPICRGSSGSSSSSGYFDYDPYEAQRLADEAAAAEALRLKRLEEARKKKLREGAARLRKKWDANDAETMRQMESMFASPAKKKIPKLKCDCDHGWRDCPWCENGLRDCTRYGCRDGKLVCGCVRPGVGPDPKCPDCNGTGEIECPICNGSGKVPCNWCEHGRVRCWACNPGFHDPTAPVPGPLADARNAQIKQLADFVDDSGLSATHKKRLAAARAAYLIAKAPPPVSEAMQTVEQAVFDRDRELFNALLAKHGGTLPTDPAAKAAFVRELQVLMESDPERNLLLGKQIHQDFKEAAEKNSALAQAIHVAGGASVLVPSFNAKVVPLQKNNLRNQIKGPLGAYVSDVLSRDQLKQRLTVLEEYAIDKDACQEKAARLHRLNRQALDSQLAKYPSERDALEKQQGGFVSERELITHLHEKYKTNPELKQKIERMADDYMEVQRCLNIKYKAEEAQAAAYREWKRLLDDYDGAARVAVDVNREVKARARNDLVKQMDFVAVKTQMKEQELRDQQQERKKIFRETYEKIRLMAREDYKQLPEER